MNPIAFKNSLVESNEIGTKSSDCCLYNSHEQKFGKTMAFETSTTELATPRRSKKDPLTTSSIPYDVLADNILPYLNRSSWNSLHLSSKELFRRCDDEKYSYGEQVQYNSSPLPPWPNDVIILHQEEKYERNDGVKLNQIHQDITTVRTHVDDPSTASVLPSTVTIHSVAISSSSSYDVPRYIACGCNDGYVRIWDCYHGYYAKIAIPCEVPSSSRTTTEDALEEETLNSDNISPAVTITMLNEAQAKDGHQIGLQREQQPQTQPDRHASSTPIITNGFTFPSTSSIPTVQSIYQVEFDPMCDHRIVCSCLPPSIVVVEDIRRIQRRGQNQTHSIYKSNDNDLI